MKETRQPGSLVSIFQASTTPDKRVSVSGTLVLGIEGVFGPDELDQAAARAAEQGRLPQVYAWQLRRTPAVGAQLETAVAEARRLSIGPGGLNLRVRMVGKFRYLPQPGASDREFFAERIEQITICPKLPAAIDGCSN